MSDDDEDLYGNKYNLVPSRCRLGGHGQAAGLSCEVRLGLLTVLSLGANIR